MFEHDPAPAVLTRLQRAYEQHGARQLGMRTADAPTGSLYLVWHDRALVTTGPGTYRLTVPVVGAPASPALVRAVAAELTDACRRALDDGPAIRAIYARTERLSALRSYLALFITTADDDRAPRDDSRRVAASVRAALAQMPVVRFGP